jgi:hypothetical protein
MAISFPGSSVNLQNVRFTDLDSTPLFSLGTMTLDSNGSWWQYVDGGGTIAQYEYVKISTDGLFVATSLTTTTNPSTEPGQVGCVQASGLTTSGYCWVIRSGYHIGKFAASCVQDVKIYTTATAGVVDDSATTLVNGLKLITTITSATSAPAYANCIMTTVAA